MNTKVRNVLSAITIGGFLAMAAASTGSSENATKAEGTSATEKKENWTYSEEVDKMTGKKYYVGSCTSTNTVEFKFPYSGGSTFTLIIRTKDGRQDVMVSVSKGQFMTSIMSSESCRVRFDDGEVTKFAYNMPSDASSDLIFLTHEKSFMAKLKKAKKLMIEAPFFDAGNTIMEFDVAGLNWDK